MKKIFIMLALTAMLSALAFGQFKGADIYGTTVLNNGSALSGVTVTLTGDVIGRQTVVTSAEGNFRFLDLPPGVYRLRFELGGYQTLIHNGIRLFVGKNKKMKVELSTGAGVIEITGQSGALDARKTTAAINITSEMLTALPTARNPWTILNLVPGMMLDREDVGGNESGQQSGYYSPGTVPEENTWYINGANATGPSSVGAAPSYLNTNSYEEIQVTLGSNDIASQTGGTQLNFVTKRSGNRFSGNFYLYVEDESLEMEQQLPQSIIDAGNGSPGIYRFYQYGVNFGGPIIKDKLWFFGSYGVQDIHSRTIAQTEDTTWLLGYYGKLDFQFGSTSGSFLYTFDNKKKWGRTVIGAANQSPETFWNQDGPGKIFLADLQQVFGNLMLNFKLAYMDGGFILDPKADVDGWMLEQDNGATGPDWYFYYTPSWWWEGGCRFFKTDNNSLNLSLEGNYYAEGVLGGDHEIRFGVDYYTAGVTSSLIYPNRRILWIFDRNDPQLYKEIWWIRDYKFDAGFERISFYLSDSATFGNLTANIGIRYDKETGSHNAVTIPGVTFEGTPIFTDYLGDLTIPARDIDAAYEVLSPRLSLSYDIFGSGTDVLKASFARYGGQSGMTIANHVWGAPLSEIDVYWDDKNGDLVPQVGEWDETYGTWYYWSINPFDPYATTSPNTFDPDFNSPILTELTLAYEKSLGDDVAVSANFFYKKTTNITWYRGIFSDDKTGAPVTYHAGDLETADNWYQKGTFVFADGTSKPYYERYYIPDASYLTNHSNDRYNLYTALQLIFSKKLSNGWMLDASFTYANWKQHYDANEEYDHTNFDFFQDAVHAWESGGSGIHGIYVNSRWQFKLSGLYQLPWGISITGVFQAREGYIVPYHELLRRGSGLGWTEMYEVGKKMGDDRLPTFWMLNLGLEKTFTLSDTSTVTLFVDGYNITNNSTTLKVNSLIGSSQDDIERILNPGIFQFGVRVSF